MDYEKEKAKMIEEAEKSLITIDGVIYDKRFNDLVSYPKSKEKEEFVVPDGTVSIRQNAFAEVENLKRIEMPSSVVRIGERAFYKSKIETVILSDNIEIIEKSAFEHCKELSTVNIPKNIDEICISAFSWCESLKEISLPRGLDKIGAGAFSFCSKLERVIIPETVYELGNNAFSGCKSLKNAVITNNVKKIGDYAFMDCSSLKSIVIPSTVAEMGENVFEYCTSLETIYCQAESKPDTWNENWLNDCDAEVVWGYNK
jgi:hypothetical protein